MPHLQGLYSRGARKCFCSREVLMKQSLSLQLGKWVWGPECRQGGWQSWTVFWTQARKLGFRTTSWPLEGKLNQPRSKGKVGASDLLGSLGPQAHGSKPVLERGSWLITWLGVMKQSPALIWVSLAWIRWKYLFWWGLATSENKELTFIFSVS